MLDDHYELSWGFPQQGRAVYAKLGMGFEQLRRITECDRADGTLC